MHVRVRVRMLGELSPPPPTQQDRPCDRRRQFPLLHPTLARTPPLPAPSDAECKHEAWTEVKTQQRQSAQTHTNTDTGATERGRWQQTWRYARPPTPLPASPQARRPAGGCPHATARPPHTRMHAALTVRSTPWCGQTGPPARCLECFQRSSCARSRSSHPHQASPAFGQCVQTYHTQPHTATQAEH